MLQKANFLYSDLVSHRIYKMKQKRWQKLDHLNVSKVLGLAYNLGYIPTLVLPFYSQGDVLRFLKDKTDNDKLPTVNSLLHLTTPALNGPFI